MKPIYTLNDEYFVEINTPDKAYWLGFIWGDGYICCRKRKTSLSYELKIGLSSKDIGHLFLLNSYLDSSYPIRQYDIKTGFQGKHKEARFYVARKAFVKPLYDLGIQPGRTEFNSLIPHVPEHLYVHLMRGIIDSDGGFTQKNITYNKRSEGVIRTEYAMHLIANPEVLDFFNDLLIQQGITETTYKQTKRHEGHDGNVFMMRITGNNITERIATWLYEGNEHLSLQRKYQKYLEVKSYMDSYRREKCNV